MKYNKMTFEKIKDPIKNIILIYYKWTLVIRT